MLQKKRSCLSLRAAQTLSGASSSFERPYCIIGETKLRAHIYILSLVKKSHSELRLCAALYQLVLQFHLCIYKFTDSVKKKEKNGKKKISPFYYTTAATSQTNQCPPPVTWEQWYSCKCQSSATENPTTCHIKLNSECRSRSVLVSWHPAYLIFKTYSTEICKLHCASPEKSRYVIYKKPLLKYLSCGTDGADLLVALHHLTQAEVCQHCLGIGPDRKHPSHHVVPFTTHTGIFTLI